MKRVKKLIDEMPITFLATTDGKKPAVRPMATVMTADGRVICATYPSRKTKQIAKVAAVEFCAYDPKTMNHARISGRAKLVAGPRGKMRLWRTVIRKLPQLRSYYEGPGDESLVFIELKPRRVEYMEYAKHEYEVAKK